MSVGHSLRHRFTHEVLPHFVFTDPFVFVSAMESPLAASLLHEIWRRLADEANEADASEGVKLSKDRLHDNRCLFTIELADADGGVGPDWIAIVPHASGCRYLVLEQFWAFASREESNVLVECHPDGSRTEWDTVARADRLSFVTAIQDLVSRSELQCLGCGESRPVQPSLDLEEGIDVLELTTCPRCFLTLPLALAGGDKSPERVQKLRELVLSPLYTLGLPPEALEEAARTTRHDDPARLRLAVRALDVLGESEAWVECLLRLERTGGTVDRSDGVAPIGILVRHFESAPPTLRSKLALAELLRRSGESERMRRAIADCMKLVDAERPDGDIDAIEEHRAVLRHESGRLICEIERAHRRKETYYDRHGRESRVLARVWRLLRSRRDVVEEELADGLRKTKELEVWDALRFDLLAMSSSLLCGPAWPRQILGAEPLWWKALEPDAPLTAR